MACKRLGVRLPLAPRFRRSERGHETTLVITRKTTRRHMIGNPHGQMAGKATLLVRAADEILGTHGHGDRRAVPHAQAAVHPGLLRSSAEVQPRLDAVPVRGPAGCRQERPGQRENSKSRIGCTAGKYRSANRRTLSHACPNRGSQPFGGCWHSRRITDAKPCDQPKCSLLLVCDHLIPGSEAAGGGHLSTAFSL
jgi:hypothetical protein